MPKPTQEVSEGIDVAFRNGQEYLLDYDAGEMEKVDLAFAAISNYLSTLPTEESFPGVSNQNLDVTRKTFWVGSSTFGSDFCTEKEGLDQFDGNHEGGIAGLKALGDTALRDAVEYLKPIYESALSLSAKAVGIPEGLLGKCSVRTRVAWYPRDTGGIGTHFDSDVITALLTSQPGLVLYYPNGGVSKPPSEKVVVTAGSMLYRRSQVYIPAVHNVPPNKEHDTRGTEKVSVAAFLNFPDSNVKELKIEDWGKFGELHKVWEAIEAAHPGLTKDV